MVFKHVTHERVSLSLTRSVSPPLKSPPKMLCMMDAHNSAPINSLDTGVIVQKVRTSVFMSYHSIFLNLLRYFLLLKLHMSLQAICVKTTEVAYFALVRPISST